MTEAIHAAFGRLAGIAAIRKQGRGPPKCGVPVEPVQVLGQAKTIKAAEEHAKRLLGKGADVSYEGMDLGFANQVNLKLAELKKRFGLKIKRISLKSGMKDLAGNQVQAMHVEKTREIILNTDMVSTKGLKGLGKDLASDFKKGFRASPKTVDLLSHEYGHAVFDALPKAKQLAISEWRFTSGFGGQIGSQVSRYAERNIGEFFAESFTRVVDGTAPKPIVELFKQLGVL